MAGEAQAQCGGHFIGHRRKVFYASSQTPDPDVMRHWTQGPYLLRPFGETMKRRTSDGELVDFTHQYPFYIAEVTAGLSKTGIKRLLTEAWRDSGGWVRAGVWPTFVANPEAAACVIRVVRADDPACGDNAHASCVTSGARQVKMVLREAHLRPGPHPGIAYHEAGHAIFAMIDMVSPGGYTGVMEYGSEGSVFPTEKDIRFAVRWKHGEARYTTG